MNQTRSGKALTGTQRSNIEDATGFQKRISDELAARKMSMRKLSAAAGLGATTIRNCIEVADTISLDTAIKIANALNIPVKALLLGERVIIKGADGLGDQRVRIVGISERTAGVDHPPSGDRGVALLQERGLPDQVRAFRMGDSSMLERGQNEPIPASLVVAKDDVVVWAPGKGYTPGALAVVRESYGNKPGLTVRRIVVSDLGEMSAAANDIDFGRQPVSESAVLGAVIAIQRPLLSQ